MSFEKGSVVLGPGAGKTVSVSGNPYTFKVRGNEARGAYALVEVTVVGDGPPPHIHLAEEEGFYIVDGTLHVTVGDQMVLGTPGSFILIPRGMVHTFSRAGTPSAKVLVLISPAGFEQFFEEIAGPPDLDRIQALAEKYHLKILNPPNL
jgi:quercetin dioxygenase-like cupin family protein